MVLGVRAGRFFGQLHAYSPMEADSQPGLAWHLDPGDRQPVIRILYDRRTETWCAADAILGWWNRTTHSGRPALPSA